MPDQIRNDRRAWAALRQSILEARDLGQDRSDFRVQLEILVRYEVTANAPKIDRAEEILYIDIEDVSSVSMPTRIGNDRSLSLKTMSNVVWILVVVASVVCLVDLLDTVSARDQQRGAAIASVI